MVNLEDLHRMTSMPGLIYVPFHPSHIDRLNLHPVDQELLSCFPDIENRLKMIAASGDAWTIFYKMQPALSFGLESRWPGMAEAWLLPGQVSVEHGALLSRGARRFFDNIGPHLGLRRMQIVVSVNRNHAIQWAKFLKFKEEGLMKQYGPEGFDYWMYARTY